jgi:hypothetical protein
MRHQILSNELLDSATVSPDLAPMISGSWAPTRCSVPPGSSRSKLNCRNLLLTALLCLSGCIADGVSGDPISRRFTWFSMLGGEDIRNACGPGAPARYRLVYNGIYTEQVRVYELWARPDGSAVLDTTVLAGGVSVGSSTPADLGALVGGRRARVELTPDQSRDLQVAMEASGVLSAPPVGLRLRSDAFYWTTSACVGGRFAFNAFDHPSPRFAALRFPTLLFQLERSGVALNPPRPLDLGPFELTGAHETGPGRRTGPRFLVEVGANGLVH